MEPITNLFGMCTSINDKNCNYKPCKSFIVQNHLSIYGKKHKEKIYNTGKTQGILSWLERGHPVILLEDFGEYIVNYYSKNVV